MIKTIGVDDFRDLQVDVLCRTYDEGIEKLSNEKFDILYLDHDLGCWDKDSGRDLNGKVLLEHLYAIPVQLPKVIVLVSGNPIGLDRQRLSLIDMGYKQVKEYKTNDVHLIGGTTMVFDDECQECIYINTPQCATATLLRYTRYKNGECPYREVSNESNIKVFRKERCVSKWCKVCNKAKTNWVRRYSVC